MIVLSFARSAVFQPLLQASCAIAEPSSCARLPKLKQSFVPPQKGNFGPSWSVPMHGATVSRWFLIADSWRTGAARFTSQVVKMIFAPSLISWSAHALEAAALSLCVSQVLSTILRPSTFFWLTFFSSSCAAASAGPSNGCIGPVLSWAQPMTIGPFAAECVLAAAAATKTSAPAAAITSAQRARLLTLMFLLSGPRLPPGPSFSTRCG